MRLITRDIWYLICGKYQQTFTGSIFNMSRFHTKYGANITDLCI